MSEGFKDLVVTELRRAGPEGLEKDALQKQTGLGAGELRTALELLRVAGTLGEEDGAYVLREPLRAVEPDETPAGGEGPVEPEEAASGPEEGAEEDLDWLPPEELTAFRVSVEFVVEYRSRDARTAVEDARLIYADAKAGIQAKSPLLHVAEGPMTVTEFRERRVWPENV